MAFWKTDFEDGNSTSSVLAGLQDLVDSPNISRDSIDYSSDDPNSITSDQPESLNATKASLLAKKRLQAYSTVNKVKSGSAKEDKDELIGIEKPPKSTFRKLKKTVYPDDAAKAVIRDIEILKRAGFGGLPVSSMVPADIIPLEPFVPISLSKLHADKSPTISLCSDMDEENLFKKREIRCRNIRKSETNSKRSPTPKSNKSESTSKKEKKEYPLNWTEYKELNLNTHKDAALKVKLFKKPRSKHFSFKKYFNFESPSPPMESFKCQPISGESLWIPFPYIRYTASKPQVLFSANQQVATSGCLTREQLFSIIPKERKAVIERIWTGAPSRCQQNNKKSTSRKWYPKNWKKFDNTQAKLLEKSVGLSFLQGYSDEEEDDVLEDNNEELDVDQEIINSVSPSATPKKPKTNEFKEKIRENSEQLGNVRMVNWDQSNANEFDIALPSAIELTPPVEEREDGEVSIDENSKATCENEEYLKTKKELERLEQALKKTPTNLLDIVDKIPVEKDEKKNKRKKSKSTRQERESKSKIKKNKSKRKLKKKVKEESDDELESSYSEKESIKKKKQKGRRKHLKDKTDKKEKRRKARKKKSKKRAEVFNDSDNFEAESEVEESAPKKIRKRKRKSTDKGKKRSTNEELSGKMSDRKDSADITHEGYEDDIKFFTARFDDDLDLDISRRIRNKNRTNINLEELTIPSKSDAVKTIKRKSKRDTSESDEKLEGSRRQSADRNKLKDASPKNTEAKEEGKKDEIKIDLLKKNEEYLREQDKLRVKQKKVSCDDVGLNLVKTPDSSMKSEDESLKNQKSEKPKAKDILEKKSDIPSNESKEHESDKVLDSIKSPKKTPKDSDSIKPCDDFNMEDKKIIKTIESTIKNEAKLNEHTKSKVTSYNKDNKDSKEDMKEPIKKNTSKVAQNTEVHKIIESDKSEIPNPTNVDDKDLTENSGLQRQEDIDPSNNAKEPDWEKLKKKRKRHISDTTQDQIDKSKQPGSESTRSEEMFPLESQLPVIHIKQEKEDDDEKCRANDQESTSEQMNTSWETDEEVVHLERPACPVNEDNLFDLEIPLNIKHFTRREIKVENDALDKHEELRQLERHSRDLSVERRKLAIETMKVKELQRELHVQEKELQQKRKKKEEKSYLKTKRDDRGQGESGFEFIVQTPPKKRRWDIKSSDCKASTPKIKTENVIEIIDVDANTSHNVITLENEYEEFLKAVTTTKKEHRHQSNEQIVIDSGPDVIILNEHQKSKQQFESGSSLSKEGLSINNSSPFKQVITNFDDLIPSKPKEPVPFMDIPTLQIPLPPTQPEEVRPVPVPLPKLEAVFDLNKPLINLSVSANVTQNITFSLATSVSSISAPITSSIDISKPSVEILTPASRDTIFSMNNIPVPVSETMNTSTCSPATNWPDLKLYPMVSETLPARPPLSKEEINFPSYIYPELEGAVDQEIQNPSIKPKIIFATLTLPSKKPLLNNSNLNLDDSDNDDQAIIEEIKRKKLEALIEDNKKEVFIEEVTNQVRFDDDVPIDRPKAASPLINKPVNKEDSSKKTSPHKSSHSKHELSPRRKRESPLKRRDPSPKRRSPRRRSPRKSPKRRSPAKKRSPPGRRRSPGKRSISPRRRRSVSPRKRRSPGERRKRSVSPKGRQSPRRNRSISPKNKKRSLSPGRYNASLQRNRSPRSNERKKSPVPSEISSPFGGPKRSVADSTISDDQLPQSTSIDDYSDTLFSHFREKDREPEYDSPKRLPLDVRINQVLGFEVSSEEPQKRYVVPSVEPQKRYEVPSVEPQKRYEVPSVEPQKRYEVPSVEPQKRYEVPSVEPQKRYEVPSVEPQKRYEVPCIEPQKRYEVPSDEPQKPTSSTIYNYNDHQQLYQYAEEYSSIRSQVTTPTMRHSSSNQIKRVIQSSYKQVGNMLQIVPHDDDDINDIPIPDSPYQEEPLLTAQITQQISWEQDTSMNMDIKPQILQVGNMLQIVPTEMLPTDMIPVPPTLTEVKIEKNEDIFYEMPLACASPEKTSAEAAMLLKIAERRSERENRRKERERRRKEKERRNKEKEKVKQAKMKIKTENMIKKALELEQAEDAEGNTSESSVIQWPPLPIVVTHSVMKEAGKSILLTSSNRKIDMYPEEKRLKIVQFADGVRPGEGTSPSAGEELSSPPPPKQKLPKEKRFKKILFGKKSAKKKVKVKIIKKPPSPIESDSEDTLPPPSPPPGSPPPHIFPPRIKVNTVNNVPAGYLTTIIQTAQQQQQQQIQQQQLQHQQYPSNIYCPSINLLMAPPPPPQGHASTIPPHLQSPHGTAAASPHGQQTHYHPSLAPPPPPPPASPHNHYSSGSSGQSGHHRHF